MGLGLRGFNVKPNRKLSAKESLVGLVALNVQGALAYLTAKT